MISNSHKSLVRISVTLSSSNSRSLSYQVAGQDDKTVDYHARNIEGFLYSLKPWYSLVVNDSIYIGYAVLNVLIIYFIISFLNIKVSNWTLLLILFAVSSFFINLLFNKIRDYLFPKFAGKITI